jgi:predicted amidohydrolase YtcJ
MLADLVAFRGDPCACAVDELRAMKPAFTMVGGRFVHRVDDVHAHG